MCNSFRLLLLLLLLLYYVKPPTFLFHSFPSNQLNWMEVSILILGHHHQGKRRRFGRKGKEPLVWFWKLPLSLFVEWNKIIRTLVIPSQQKITRKRNTRHMPTDYEHTECESYPPVKLNPLRDNLRKGIQRSLPPGRNIWMITIPCLTLC